MADSWNKKEREKKKQQEKRDKEARKKERKENAASGKDDMIAYVDENGNISDTPPDPRKRKEIKLEDIEIGVPEYVPPTEAELTHTGKLTFFNHEKGFGFIKDLQTQESVFVHINNATEPLNENDKVSFEIGHGPKGPMAVNVKKIS
jgi:cold shock CspA family protein